MFKVLRYLKESKAAVAAIIALLILQAYCDLALPQFTADIVDVGIGQGGIENAVPRRMRGETMEKLAGWMGEDESLLRSSYRQLEDGSYELEAEEEAIEKLDESLEMPMAKLVLLSVPGGSDMDLEDMSGSMLTQMAVNGVKAEYEALGMSIASVQTKYLLGKGGIMLALSIFMMAAAILAGLLSARTSAKIGRNLRERVFHKVVSFSDTEMDQFSTASLITRSTNDIQQIQMVSVMLLRMVLYAPIVGAGGIMKVVNTKTGMGWIIIVAVLAIMLLVFTLMRIAMPKFKIMQGLVDKLNLVSREILTGIPVIRAFSREKFEEERFDRANRELMGTQLFTNRVMTFMMPVMMMIMNGVAVMIVWFGLWEWMRETFR